MSGFCRGLQVWNCRVLAYVPGRVQLSMCFVSQVYVLSWSWMSRFARID